ncbi:MAG TPA: PQQ-binding-like beta-propeller repeat protein, partial [Chitinophagaceae bacterium]
YAINAATGSLNWRFYAGGTSLEESCPAVSDSIVYVGGWYTIPNFNQKGSFYAVNINTGQLIWEKLANTGFGSSPSISDGRVYIAADDGNFYALDATTGTILWKQLIYANGASPAVYDGTVYVGGGGTSHIYAFDAISGVIKWEFPLKSLMISTPIIIVQGS